MIDVKKGLEKKHVEFAIEININKCTYICCIFPHGLNVFFNQQQHLLVVVVNSLEVAHFVASSLWARTQINLKMSTNYLYAFHHINLKRLDFLDLMQLIELYLLHTYTYKYTEVLM